MEERIFTPEEEDVIDQLVTLFYYAGSGSQPILEQARLLLNTQSQEARTDLIEYVLNRLKSEQYLRRSFVVERLGPGLPKLEKVAQEVLVLAVANSRSNQLRQTIDEQPINIGAIPTDVLEQAKLFAVVHRNMEDFGASLLNKQVVEPLFPLINQASIEDLTGLSAKIENFTTSLSELGLDAFTTNPAIPEPITELLKRVRVGYSLEKYQTPAEKLAFLNRIDVVARAIAQNKQKTPPLAEERVKDLVARWLYYLHTPIEYSF